MMSLRHTHIPNSVNASVSRTQCCAPTGSYSITRPPPSISSCVLPIATIRAPIKSSGTKSPLSRSNAFGLRGIKCLSGAPSAPGTSTFAMPSKAYPQLVVRQPDSSPSKREINKIVRKFEINIKQIKNNMYIIQSTSFTSF